MATSNPPPPSSRPQGTGTGPHPDPRATRHQRALLLSEVAAEGPPALSRVLRRATAGDEAAAEVPVAALVHAVPGMTALDGFQLLRRAHIAQSDLAGDLTAGQRVALLELVGLTDRLRSAMG